ncbi:MAG: FtsK/SpoIIIE domain-containing protein [Oscillospiraceae bacterium]
MEMYHLADIRSWDLLKQWKTHRAYESIRAQIGVSYGAQPVYLDIHEKQHGLHWPRHAGTTGSGKEQSWSRRSFSPLMLNYHPDSEVAFILIDYKGGGMANSAPAARRASRRRHYEYLRIRARRGKKLRRQRQPDAARCFR